MDHQFLLVADPRAVALRQCVPVEFDLAPQNLQPRVTTGFKFMRDMPPGIERRQIDPGVLVDQQRTFGGIRRSRSRLCRPFSGKRFCS